MPRHRGANQVTSMSDDRRKIDYLRDKITDRHMTSHTLIEQYTELLLQWGSPRHPNVLRFFNMHAPTNPRFLNEVQTLVQLWNTVGTTSGLNSGVTMNPLASSLLRIGLRRRTRKP